MTALTDRPTSLAEVLNRIQAAGLPGTRRRDLASAELRLLHGDHGGSDDSSPRQDGAGLKLEDR